AIAPRPSRAAALAVRHAIWARGYKHRCCEGVTARPRGLEWANAPPRAGFGDAGGSSRYTRADPDRPEEFVMADHRKLDILEEKGFAILKPYEGEIDPSE